jgi:glycosyltransferase involved in cell wall biosynthesis
MRRAMLMNVLVIAQYFPPDLGGSATRAHNVAKGLTLNGCNVTVIAAFPHYPHGRIPAEYRWKPLKIEWMNGFRVIRTFMPPVRSVGFFRRLLLIGAFAFSALFALPFVGRVDVVWASSWVPGLVYGRVKRKPIALNVDDLTLEDLVDLELIEKDSFVLRVAEWVYRFFLVKADAVTPISLGYIEILSKKYCIKPSKIHVVMGGVDLSVFKRGLSKRSDEKFVVLYSGAFSVAYDFEQLFKAARIVEEFDGDVEFVVQGAGELLDSMCSRVNDLGVKNVRIINKVLSREAVAELLSQADVLILPLTKFKKPYRGFSSKLYEYQAAGKPIICCADGQPAEHVRMTGSGFVVKPGDYEALAKAVLWLKENVKLALEMAENGRKYVEKEASIEAIGLKMKTIFELMIRQGK